MHQWRPFAARFKPRAPGGSAHAALRCEPDLLRHAPQLAPYVRPQRVWDGMEALLEQLPQLGHAAAAAALEGDLGDSRGEDGVHLSRRAHSAFSPL